MSNAILIIASDTHLFNYKIGVMRYKDYDAYFPMMQIFNYAINKELPVALAGDVFDKRILDPVTYFVAKICIENLNKIGKKTYFVQGQHEYNDILPWLSTIGGAVHINNKIEKIDSFNLFGLDYSYQREYYEDQISTIPPSVDILLTHYTWRDLIFTKDTSLLDFSFVTKNAPQLKMVITGDYHDKLLTKIGNTIFFSPGSTTIRSINEPADKYFYELINDNGELKIKPIKILSRPSIFLFICKKELKQKILSDKYKPKILDCALEGKDSANVIEFDGINDNNFNAEKNSKIIEECKLAITAEKIKFSDIYYKFLGHQYNYDDLNEKEKLIFDMNRLLINSTDINEKVCPKLFMPNLYIVYDSEQKYTVNTLVSDLEKICFVKCINVQKENKAKQPEQENNINSSIEFESIIEDYLSDSKINSEQKNELISICKDLWIAEDKNNALTNVVNKIVTNLSKEVNN